MASKGTNVYKLRTFCLITGASKGLGRCISVTFAKKFPRDSVMLLVARSAKELLETKTMVEKLENGIIAKVVVLDLTQQTADHFKNIIDKCLKELKVKPEDFEQAMIVHNAASMGDVSKKVVELDDRSSLSTYFDLNLTSVLTLNSTFLQLFPQKATKDRVVIHISSICAQQPFKTWSLYCAGKAARDMLFRTMALESTDIRILNYSPGPLDTEMQHTARTKTGDEELKRHFAEMFKNEKLLTCQQSVDKLVTLMETNRFESGCHLDYYDACPI